ncbi:MAG: MarR family winged helix-turn-helix transcriptional regulator [Candidatus Competibacterales bacterium]
MGSDDDRCDEVLVALRRINRAMNLRSRQLMQTTDITGPQLMLLHALRRHGSMTIGQVANAINLSQGTVTSILERLLKKGVVKKTRSVEDKRKVFVELTDSGHELLLRVPTPLQQNFTTRFKQLKDWEQNLILSSLQRVAEMMNAHEIEVEPLLVVDASCEVPQA